jgi:ATPase family protein associated with various cellular activities (AAA)/winged helix domain-containing protein
VTSPTRTLATWIDEELSLTWHRLGRWLDRSIAAGVRRATEPGIPELQQQIAARAGDTAAPAAARLGGLTANLGLQPLELEVLAAALAPHLDPALEEAFAAIRHRRGVDLGLVAELLDLDRADRLALVDALDPDRPLLALRLLAVEPGEGRAAFARQVQVPLDVVALFAGRGELSPALRRSARLIDAPADLGDLVLDEIVRDHLIDACAAIADSAALADPPWVVLWGRRSAGKRTLAARIAALAGRPLLALDTTTINDGGGDEQLRRAQREALLHGAILYIGPVAGELLASGGRELVRRLAGFRGMILFGVESDRAPRFTAPRALRELAVPELAAPERLALWQRSLGDAGRDLALDGLARGFRITPGEIAEIASEARANGTVTAADLRQGVIRRLRSELGDLATPVTIRASWDQLVLPEDQRVRVRELIDRHRLADQVYRQWGLGARVGYGKGVIALFSGPPGTGKTMLAGLVAAELELDLYKVDLSKVVSKWVGETEKELGRLFDLAARAHAVLLFDEADALLGARTKVESSNDRYGNLAVNYLLQRLEDYEGVAILTTNHAASLDAAVQRRLTLHLRLGLPGEDERARLWRSFLGPAVPGADRIDVAALADEFELSGGHTRNAAVRAAFLAAHAGRPLDMELVRHAARLELDGMGRPHVPLVVYDDLMGFQRE